jgi:hypothetical protein
VLFFCAKIAVRDIALLFPADKCAGSFIREMKDILKGGGRLFVLHRFDERQNKARLLAICPSSMR